MVRETDWHLRQPFQREEQFHLADESREATNGLHLPFQREGQHHHGGALAKLVSDSD